jgi:hypothetical protein
MVGKTLDDYTGKERRRTVDTDTNSQAFAGGMADILRRMHQYPVGVDGALISNILVMSKDDPKSLKKLIYNAHKMNDSKMGITTLIYNSVDAVYPFLDGEGRVGALMGVLSILDMIRYDHVQYDYTSHTNSPELLADVTIARRIYWPTKEQAVETIAKAVSEAPDATAGEIVDKWLDGQGNFKRDVKGHFMMAYSLLRKDVCGNRLAHEYYKRADPDFVERTLRAIGMMYSAPGVFYNPEERAEGEAHLREAYIEEVAERIIAYSRSSDQEHIKRLIEARK